MARRSTAQRDLDDLIRKVHRTLDGSPLSTIGERFLEILEGTAEAIRSGSARSDQDKNVVNYIRARFDALPHKFGKRFFVDAAIIHGLADEWSRGAVSLSSMIVPRYSRNWGHQSLDLTHINGERHYIDVILIPGDDDLSSMDILDYPWLCHELGHCLHFRDRRFADNFQTRLDARLRSLRTRAIADRGAAKTRAKAQIDQLEQIWTPTNDHNNWPYEIAVDLVALWVCGPAFLAAFAHQLSERKPNPYQLTQAHPPYDVRSAALIDAAHRLGWNEYIADLERYRQTWSSEFVRNRSNEFVALADEELVTAAATCGLATCDEFQLPRADSETLSRLKVLVDSPAQCDFGSELMIAAWLAESGFNDDTRFDTWHQAVVAELDRAVTPESH